MTLEVRKNLRGLQAVVYHRFVETARMIRQSRLVPLETRLERALEKVFRAQGRAFIRLFERVKGEVWPLDEDQWLRPLLQAQTETRPMFLAAIRPVVEAAMLQGIAHAAEQVTIKEAREAGLEDYLTPIAIEPTVAGSIRFDLGNPRAVQYIDDHGAALVTRVDATTREYIKGVIAKGTDRGWSYDEMARQITSRYAEFAVGRPQEHIKSRAHLIAVTEVGNAYSEGNLQMAQRIAGAGIPMEKKWDTMGDERVDAECLANAAEGWIPLDQAFSSGHLRPLAHPACRCDLLIQPVEEQLYPGSPEDEDVWIDDRLYKLDQEITDEMAAMNLKNARQYMGGTTEYQDERIQRFQDLLKEENFPSKEVHVRTDYDGAKAILQDGRFKSQFESKHSHGLYDPEFRRDAENTGLGAPLKLDPRDRPIYGYIPLRASTSGESQYGAVDWVLKKTVNNRTTATLGDSLGGFVSGEQAGVTFDRLHMAAEAWSRNQGGVILGVAAQPTQAAAMSSLIDRIVYVETQVQGGIKLDDIARVFLHDVMRDPVTSAIVSANPFIYLEDSDAQVIEGLVALLTKHKIPFEFDKYSLDI